MGRLVPLWTLLLAVPLASFSLCPHTAIPLCVRALIASSEGHHHKDTTPVTSLYLVYLSKVLQIRLHLEVLG